MKKITTVDFKKICPQVTYVASYNANLYGSTKMTYINTNELSQEQDNYEGLLSFFINQVHYMKDKNIDNNVRGFLFFNENDEVLFEFYFTQSELNKLDRHFSLKVSMSSDDIRGLLYKMLDTETLQDIMRDNNEVVYLYIPNQSFAKEILEQAKEHFGEYKYKYSSNKQDLIKSKFVFVADIKDIEKAIANNFEDIKIARDRNIDIICPNENIRKYILMLIEN